jgi:hypothetical protein
MSRSNVIFPWLTPHPGVTWWIEFEDGHRSDTYRGESGAWDAAIDLHSRPELHCSRPASLVSSTGLRFVIPV